MAAAVMPSREAAVAVDDQVGGQALILLVGGDVAQLGHRPHPGLQLRRPGVQLVQVLVRERVLVLRSAAAAADLNFLLTWRKSVAPGTLVSLPRRRLTTWSAETRPGRWSERLERDEHEAHVVAAAGRRRAKAVTELNGRIVEHHLRQLALLVAHGGEADVLRGHGRAAQAACVLLREEALGHDDVEVDVERHGADDHAQHQPLVAQHPAQAGGVFVVQPLEGALAGAIDAAVAALVPRLEKLRAEHGRGGQRDQQRDGDGHRERDGELAEELADDAAHQQNRNEDGDQRRAHGEHREADLLRALHRRFEGRHRPFRDSG